MPDIIITPSTGKLEFVDVSAQATRRHSFTLNPTDGLNLDSPLSAAAISAPLNVINVTVDNTNNNYPFVLASGSVGTGTKTLMMDGAGGTYNPFTNTATIDISGNAATATNSTQLNGQAASYYTNIPARLGYTPVNQAGDTITGNVVINGNFTVTGATTLFSASSVYISSSQLVVDDNIITLNAFSPFLRYTGIEMIDSGSATTSSILWDSQNDYFFLTGSGINGKIITGPDQQANLTSGKIPKSTGNSILGDSIISDNGSAVSIAGNISATNLSGTNTGDQTIGDATLTVAAGSGISLSATPTFTANATTNKTITVTNSGVTAITTNTGLSANTSATGSVTITNTGVTSNVAGTGISVSGATGAVTITNSGVTSAVAGTGISVSGATGAVTITNGGVTSVAGTTNQVSVSAATGGVTFSLPQNIHTAAAPTFAGATLNGQLNVNHSVSTAIVRLWNAGSTIWSLGVNDTSGNYFNISADFGSVLINKTNGNIWISGSGINNTVLHSGTTSAPNLSIGGNAATVTTNANLTGDVTSTGNATTIASNAVTSVKIADSNVTLAKIANISTGTILGNNGAGAAAPLALTSAQVASMLSGQTMNIAGSSTSCTGNAATATTATTANALNTGNSYTGVNFTATGYFQTNLGQIKSDTSFALLTTSNGAQGVSARGLLLGTSYDGAPGANEIRTTNNTSLYLNARGTGDIQFQTADSLKMMLLNNGNVGIGTSVPGQKLDVEGRIRTRGATGTGGFEIGAATTGTAKWRIEWDSASDSLDFNWVG